MSKHRRTVAADALEATSASRCQHCGADTSGAGYLALCSRCQRTVGVALVNVAASYADLFTIGAGPSGLRIRGGDSDPTAAAASRRLGGDPIEDAADEAKAALVGWVRSLLDDRPQLAKRPADNVEALARLLGQNVRSIATLPWAGSMAHELLELERRLRRIIEANKGKWYAGVCGHVPDDVDPEQQPETFCTRVLYADPDSDFVRCPVCRTNWSVSWRREVLLDQARDEVTNVATIARALVALLEDQPSVAKLEARIQKWIERGKIERRGHLDIDGRVRKVYRLGDVLDTLMGDRFDRSA